MNLHHAATYRPLSHEQRHEADTRLHGRQLLLARILWLALVVLTVGVCIASLPDYFTELQTVCQLAPCSYGQLSPERALALQQFGLSVGSYATFMFALTVVFALASFAAGGLIFWRKSDDWMALLFALLCVIGGMFSVLSTVETSHSPWRLPILSVGDLLLLLFFLAFILFPDGRFVPRWTRWLLVVFTILAVVLEVFAFFTNLFTAPLWIAVPVFLLSFVLCAGLVIAQIYRYRYVSNFVQRQQTKWVVYGLTANMVVFVAGFLPTLIFPRSLYPLVFTLVFLCTAFLYPFTVGVALLRYRLWDIDLIINRTLVYGTLTVSIVALYVLVVVGLGALFQTQGNFGIALLATGLVAVIFQPWRHRLQRSVNHLMYGDRDDPYRVISRLGQRLEATLAPEAVLPTIVETVAQALKLPYAAMHLQQGEEILTAATYGSTHGDLMRLPLIYQHEILGELVLAPRAAGERFSPADRALLEDVARQAGIAAHAVRLTADLKRLTVDLQRSRERLVMAREEERRRLRRDLHDGLGPQLASLTLKLETARNRLAHDPLADTLLTDLTTRTQATVADIRRLVYALRPPALDELGLLAALRALTLQSGDEVAMHLDAPACLPELSAAVEVAVYRIAQEALTNVVRHAHARRCDVRLTLDETSGWLSLSIEDDGCGLPPARPLGIGLVSMRERAEELGGRWVIEQGESGGTRILARLPYARTKGAEVTNATTSVLPYQEEV